MSLSKLLSDLEQSPEQVTFQQVIDVIEANYDFTSVEFKNGEQVNDAGTNLGSCKIFYFAQLQKLTEQQTLQCFGDYYRKDVLEHPQGDDHGNIRNFIKFGWSGVEFSAPALTAK